MDLEKINKILESNKNKSFVKRILDPNNFPILKNNDGTYSTHSMAWGESDGKFYVYPTVLLTGSGELKRFTPEEAWRHTQKTKNYIVFDNASDADYFSQHYKDIWNK